MLQLIFIFSLALAGEPDDTTDESRDDASEEEEDEVEEIVVTGTRAPRDRASDPLATKVVDRAAIEASGAEDVADLLQQVPGVDVQQGLYGAELRLQGMDPDQVLVIVDGQRMNGRVGGSIDLSRIPVDSIERIEIVEGTASALYGADAMGGVVHIITRKGSDELRGSIHGRGGNVGVVDTSGGLSLGGEKATLRLDSGLHHNAAWDRNPDDPATTGDQSLQGQGSARGDLKLGPDGHVALLGSYSRRDQQGVDGAGDTAVFDRRNLIEETRVTLDPRWVTDANGQLSGHVGLSYYRDQYVLDQRDAAVLDDRSETLDTLLQAGLQVQRVWGSHDLLLGAEGLAEALSTERLEEGSASRQRMGAYAQDEWRVARPAVLLPSVRIDSDTSFGTWPTGRLATRVDPNDTIRLRASVGNGFRAPSFREQHLRFANASVGYVIEGNTNLIPERSVQTSASIALEDSKVGSLSVSGYWNEITDLIDLQTVSEDPGNLRFQYVNIADATTRGGEASGSLKLFSHEVSASYTFTDAIDRSLDRPLQGRARHRATANLAMRTRGGGTRFTARTAFVGPRFFYSDGRDPDASVSQSPAYAELDVRAQQAATDWLALFAGVDNVLDAGNADFIPLMPRLFYGGIDGRFGAEPKLRGQP